MNERKTEMQANNAVVTQINVIQVTPEHQQRLIDEMIDHTNAVMTQQPGFISMNLHRSMDGTRVCNYVQWANVETLEAACHSDRYYQQASAYHDLMIAGEPRLYDVVNITRSNHGHTTISRDYPGIIGINEVVTEPSKQSRLTELMIDFNKFARRVPGFCSSNIHCSQDGMRNLNYVQFDYGWSIKLLVPLILRLPGPQQRNREFGTPSVHLYELVYSSHV